MIINNNSYKAITEAGLTINEDYIGHSSNFVWICDGATGLTERKFTTAPSDAAYFVKEIDSCIRKQISSNVTDLNQILVNSIIEVKNTFNLPPDVTKFELPSSGIVLLRIDDDKITYSILGDCRLYYQEKDGISKRVGSSRITELDDIVIDKIVEIRDKSNKSFNEIKNDILPLLQKNRALMNSENGYWALSLSEEAVNYAQIGNIPKENIKNILLATDGFYSYCDTYNKTSEDNFITEILSIGLENIINKIRKIENDDPECKKYPRFKKSDDASAIFLNIS